MKKQLPGVIAIVAVLAWIQIAEAQKAKSVVGRYHVTKDLNKQAVLDTETGIIWERSPDGTRVNWEDAQLHCNRRVVGSRMGWRLPTVTELTSVLDPTESNPALTRNVFGTQPFELPVTPLGGRDFWSATQAPDPPDPDIAWTVDVTFADAVRTRKIFTRFAWCVRGGHGVDFQ